MLYGRNNNTIKAPNENRMPRGGRRRKTSRGYKVRSAAVGKGCSVCARARVLLLLLLCNVYINNMLVSVFIVCCFCVCVFFFTNSLQEILMRKKKN